MKPEPRNFIVFEADIPTDSEEGQPAGREIADLLRSAFASGDSTSEVWNEEDYGWEFTTEQGNITVSILTQLSDDWLVIVHEVSFRPSFLRGPKYQKAVETVSASVAECLSSDKRIDRVIRCTRTQFEADPDICRRLGGDN